MIVLRLEAMPDGRLDRQSAGDLTLLCATDTVGKNVEIERRFDSVGVLVILADTPNVAVRACIDAQERTSTSRLVSSGCVPAVISSLGRG